MLPQGEQAREKENERRRILVAYPLLIKLLITRPPSHKIKFISYCSVLSSWIRDDPRRFVKFWSPNFQVYMPSVRVVSSGYPETVFEFVLLLRELSIAGKTALKCHPACVVVRVWQVHLQSQFRAPFLAGCFEAVPPRAVARSGSSTTRSLIKFDKIVP